MSKPATLSITDIARATGLTPPTLRAWEERHGFPAPQRLPGGHRRYGSDDIDRIRRVLAERAAGATLAAAIGRAAADRVDRADSFFGSLRAGGAGPEPRVVGKRTMVALSHALEDECFARAERALLVGAFQERRFYDQARARWLDLARAAERAAVFADFPRARLARDGPAEVPIPARHPLQREWAIAYLAPRSSVLLLGRELPGQAREDDERRRFELVWSADPRLVRDALETAVRLTQATAPAVADALAADLAAFPHPLGLDPAFVTALTNRMIGYLDR